MTRDEKEKHLRDNGWRTWHSKDYWVHPDTVQDPTRQDFTDYGLNLETALRYEKIGRPKFNYCGGIPVASLFEMFRRTNDFRHPPLGDNAE